MQLKQRNDQPLSAAIKFYQILEKISKQSEHIRSECNGYAHPSPQTTLRIWKNKTHGGVCNPIYNKLSLYIVS